MKIKRLAAFVFMVAACFTGNVFAGGELDPAFGVNGKVTYGNTSLSEDAAGDVKIQSDGKIVVAGVTRINQSPGDIMLVRLHSNGQPDNSFGFLGKVVTDLGGNETPSGIDIQSGGKIVVVGTKIVANSPEIFVIRYNANGTLDTTFGKSGKVFLKYNNLGTNGHDCIVTKDGIIVLGSGQLPSINGLTIFDALLVKLLPNGALNTSFGAGGMAIGPASFDTFSSEAIQLPNEKILVAGGAWPSGNPPDLLSLARYHANGALDTSFGQNGRAVLGINSSVPTYNVARALAVDALGRIVVPAFDADQDFPVVRFSSSGLVDTSFGIPAGQIQMGVATLPWNSGANTRNYSVAIQADGKVVTAGNYGSTFALARYTLSGAPDATFNGNGLMAASMGATTSVALKLAIQPDGRIVAVGKRGVDSDADFAIARFLP